MTTPKPKTDYKELRELERVLDSAANVLSDYSMKCDATATVNCEALKKALAQAKAEGRAEAIKLAEELVRDENYPVGDAEILLGCLKWFDELATEAGCLETKGFRVKNSKTENATALDHKGEDVMFKQ